MVWSNFSRQRRSSSFTLIEAMVSVGIILVLTTVSVTSINTFKRKNALDETATTIKNLINETRAMALSPQDYWPDSTLAENYFLVINLDGAAQQRWLAYCVNPSSPTLTTTDLNNCYTAAVDTNANLDFDNCPVNGQAQCAFNIPKFGYAIFAAKGSGYDSPKIFKRSGTLPASGVPLFTIDYYKKDSGVNQQPTSCSSSQTTLTRWCENNKLWSISFRSLDGAIGFRGYYFNMSAAKDLFCESPSCTYADNIITFNNLKYAGFELIYPNNNSATDTATKICIDNITGDVNIASNVAKNLTCTL